MNEIKAEWWLCLARAFLPPQTAEMQVALRDYLVDDLTELAQTLAYDVKEPLTKLRTSLAAYPDPQDLLPVYSRLFLVPGVAHPALNSGAYIDGSIHGDTVRKLTECYRACGLEKERSFGDLPDHVAVQLEFIAWLFATEAESASELPLNAGDFIASFVQAWSHAFYADLQQAQQHFEINANPWLHLAELIHFSAGQEATVTPPAATQEETEIERLRREYAGRMPNREELAEIRAKLEQDGLSSMHVNIPLQERDTQDGMIALETPQPRRHSLHADR